MINSFLKKIFSVLKSCILGERFYSKNAVVIFTVAFLFLLGLFSYPRIERFSFNVKNTYVKNILVAVSKPFLDFAKNLPFEKFFTLTRKTLLVFLDLDSNYHWDDTYYEVPKFSVLQNAKSENETFKNIFDVKKTTLPQKNIQDELLLANFEYTKKNPLRVLLVGDSQMQSLTEGFKRNVGEHSAFNLTEIAIISSGFVRNDYYDWARKLTAVFEKAKTEKTPFDAVLICLGMNDFQNFFDGAGNLLKRGTDEWIFAYMNKIKTVMDILQSNVKKIYWLGLPLIKQDTLNKEITFIENAQEKIFAELNFEKVTRISVRKIISKENAPYSDFAELPNGKKINIMKDDGCHFTLAGAIYIIENIIPYFYNDFYIER